MSNSRQTNASQPGVSPNQTTIPDEDKQFLSDIGFDVAAYLGKGFQACVFNGVCNANARKRMAVGPNEIVVAPDFTYSDPISGVLYREINLNGKSCAIKMIKNSKNWTKSSYNEAKTMVDLDHPNIVEIYEVCKSPSYIYIIMELVNGEALESFLKELERKGEKLDELSAYDLIRQMTAGLKYLHNQNIVHGDLHSGNVLLSFEGNRCLCKFTDFGSCEEKTEYFVSAEYRFFSDLIYDVRVATHFKSPDFDKNLEEVEDQLRDGEIDISTFGDILPTLLPEYNQAIEVPIELREDSVLIRYSKFFVKK